MVRTTSRPADCASVGTDSEVDLRTTLKVLVQIGVPSEGHWPSDIDNFDEELSAFLYSLAKPFRGVRFVRLDGPNCDGAQSWEVLKPFLVAGFPFALGFPVPTSVTADANVPHRPDLDSIRGGQAAVAIGYKTNHFGRGQHALLIRSSWGSKWGGNGNSLLPITFLRSQLARGFWTLRERAMAEYGRIVPVC